MEPATGTRWGVKSSPQLAEAFPRHKRPGWISGRLDEPAIKGTGHWYALSRAVDKTGQPLALLLPEPRHEQAATRLLPKALRRHGVPAKIPLDGREAQAAAMRSHNTEHGTASGRRQSTSLTTIVEPDHRGVQRVPRPMLGCNSPAAAQGPLAGMELMPRIKKKQMVRTEADEGRPAAEQFYAWAA